MAIRVLMHGLMWHGYESVRRALPRRGRHRGALKESAFMSRFRVRTCVASQPAQSLMSRFCVRTCVASRPAQSLMLRALDFG